MQINLLTTINVTQKHIIDGAKGGCHSCPVALAITDTLKYYNINTIYYPQVGSTRISLIHHDTNILKYIAQFENVDVMMRINNFIRDFDAGLPAQPFNFNIQFFSDF